MTKLYILSRDGKAYNDFLELHNLTKDNTVLVRSIDQIAKITKANYVLIRPYPSGYKNKLHNFLTNWNNRTSYYNKKQVQCQQFR